MLDYTFIRSRRRTIGITVKPDGSVTVRAPLSCSKKRAEAFVQEKMAWIERAQERMAKRRAMAGTEATTPPFTKEELTALKKQAKKLIPPMAAQIAAEIGVSYGTISIRAQKTRWGSCSSKGNLNFNCLLMLLPANVQRYVVVHELCHRKEMNHSPRFWREVERYCPTYKDDRAELRRLGRGLLERVE